MELSNERISKLTRGIAIAAGATALIVGAIEITTDAIPDEAVLPIEASSILLAAEATSFSRDASKWAASDRARQQG